MTISTTGTHVAAVLVAALGGILASGTADARSLEEIKESGVISIVTTSSSPPHGFLSPDSGELEGIMFEVGRAVADKLGVEAEFTEVPFNGLIPSLRSDRADLMSGPLFITEKREEVVDFTQPVYGWGEGLVTQEDSDTTYANLESLGGQTVGTLIDSVQYEMIKNVPDVEGIRTYRDYISLIADIRAGRIDVGVIDPPSIAYQIKLHGIEGVRLAEDYKPVNNWKVGMAVNEGNAELLEAVNNAIAELKSSGELKRILTDWGVGNLIAE
ncbi:ABC transporter substrate-binding protein [Rhodospirillaceae bacterium SYSU D60014]|uniref:ABC transporter substrate-binding protein n=1 Tax=Virgifigura deserti TaxID=2268457 RepID=UPI000E668C40